MDNFDSLFENQNTGFDSNQPFDKEAWAERKQAQRAQLYETIDSMADKTLSNPAALSDYLSMQSRLGRVSVSNTLLVKAQKPDASYIMSFDDWHQRGRSVNRNEKALLILEAGGEYERVDGTMGTSFDVKRVFDVSQTHGQPLRERTQAPIRARLKALATDTPVPIRVSDSVSQEIGALYSGKDNTIYVARNMDGGALFFTVARELTRVEHGGDTFICDCAANIACLRYGIPARLCDRIPKEITALDVSEKRAVLGSIREAACDIIERMDRHLYAERQQQKNQPER